MIGSGLGGLVAGALYARAGRRVLVLEKNTSFGGALGVYNVGDLTIEASLHELDGLDAGDPKLPVHRRLGLDELRFVPIDDVFELRSPLVGDPFVMPTGLEAGMTAARTRFPRHERGIRRYFAHIGGIRSSIALATRKLDEKLWWAANGPLLPFRFWPYIRHHRSSLGGVMRRLFGDDEAVKLALAANVPYYGDDPDRVWFPFYSLAQASYHIGGPHYVRGGSSVISERLVEVIRAEGGEAETSRRVTRIVLDDDRVAGVEHETEGSGGDAQRDTAPLVFGNAAPHVLAEMLPTERRARFRAPYASKTLSMSLWSVALGFDRPLSEVGARSYSTVVLPEWMRSLRDYARCGALLGEDPGERMPFCVFVDYGSIDSGLAAASDAPHLASIGGIDRAENWRGLSPDQARDRRERWKERLIGVLDREFPGLESRVVYSQMTTGSSAERYLNTPNGAVYGFAPEPPRFRLFWPETSVDGLLLASAWTGLGSYSGVTMGGYFAARAAEKHDRRRR